MAAEPSQRRPSRRFPHPDAPPLVSAAASSGGPQLVRRQRGEGGGGNATRRPPRAWRWTVRSSSCSLSSSRRHIPASTTAAERQPVGRRTFGCADGGGEDASKGTRGSSRSPRRAALESVPPAATSPTATTTAVALTSADAEAFERPVPSEFEVAIEAWRQRLLQLD